MWIKMISVTSSVPRYLTSTVELMPRHTIKTIYLLKIELFEGVFIQIMKTKP